MKLARTQQIIWHWYKFCARIFQSVSQPFDFTAENDGELHSFVADSALPSYDTTEINKDIDGVKKWIDKKEEL